MRVLCGSAELTFNQTTAGKRGSNSSGKMGDKDLIWALSAGDMDEVRAKLVTVR